MVPAHRLLLETHDSKFAWLMILWSYQQMGTKASSPLSCPWGVKEKSFVWMGNVMKEPNSPCCTGSRSCWLQSTPKERRRPEIRLLHTTDCQLSCLSPPRNPDAFIWFRLKEDKFPGFAAVSDTLIIHTLKNRNAVKWKREGPAREAEPPQFTQLSKCQDIGSQGYHIA